MAWGSSWGYYEEERSCDETQPTEEEVFKKGKWPFGMTGKAGDIPLPKDAVCAQISNVLARAEDKAGEFSFGGQAETLPVAPGLFVKGVGTVALPLCKAQAEELIQKCVKSPFGKKLETKMDDKVRKSWQLAPNQVQFKNPLWQTGMEQLSEIIAGRLGYKGVPIQCKLYKLLVYEKGGHFMKHQDTEKEDGMVATMVVQVPSDHEGGDLLVYRGGKQVKCHDFGKKHGTAAFLPHYAVHYADAEHALEKVTKGYRLVLVYSVCLPPTMRHLMRNHDLPLSQELADLIGRLSPTADTFSLLMAHAYTKQSISDLGIRALKGIDRARVTALEEASAALPASKKLQLYIVGLKHDINFYDSGDGSWVENELDESIKWYSSNGKSFDGGLDDTKFVFLNPGRESLAELWKGHGNSTFEGYLGNEGATRNTTYRRYAVVMWPAARSVENALKYIDANTALATLKAQKSIDAPTLRSFMTAAADANLDEEDDDSFSYEWSRPKADIISVQFCLTLCDLLVQVRDPALVKMFFSNFFSRLDEKEDVVSSITKIIQAFKWKDIAQELMNSLEERIDESNFRFTGHTPRIGRSGMETALRIVQKLGNGEAQQALIKFAMGQAVQLSDDQLCSSGVRGLVWMYAIRSGSKSILEPLVNKAKQMKPDLVEYSIHLMSLHIDEIDKSDERYDMLMSIVAVRIQWLKNYLKAHDKPLSWEMPNAKFRDNAHIQAFLRGPSASMTTSGLLTFTGLPDARKYATKTMRASQVNASFTMEPGGRGKDSFVTITKTRDVFAESDQSLISRKNELHRLVSKFGGSTGSTGGGATKRARYE